MITLKTRIKDLSLSTGARNCLRHDYYHKRTLWIGPTEKIETVEDLIQWSAKDLHKLPELGRKKLEEIVGVLRQSGFVLKVDPWNGPTWRTRMYARSTKVLRLFLGITRARRTRSHG